MKKAFPTFVVLFTVICFNKVSGQTTAKTQVAVQRKTVSDNETVPANNVYYVYNEDHTRLLATYKGGEVVTMNKFKKAKKESKDKPKINCAKINCPGTFASNVDCWECH